MPRTFLIDGSALAYRSFFAKGPGPAYAWAASLIALIEREAPDYVLVALDTPHPTFRHERYEAYKATRQKTPDELVAQLPTFERISTCLGFRTYALPRWEADDVLGTLARRAEAAGHDVYLVTGDKDFLQVIGERVHVYNPALPGSEPAVLGVAEVRSRFHCRPDQVIDVLALMGDSSDNVPGVPGVGEKTALRLIEQYQGLDDLYAHLDHVRPPSLQSRLRAGRESGYLSRELVTIRTDAPVELSLEELAYHGPDLEAARALFVELDFPSLLRRLSGGGAAHTAIAAPRLLATPAEYEALLQRLRSARRIALFLVSTGPVPLEAEIVSLAFACGEDEAYALSADPEPPLFGPGEQGATARQRSSAAGAAEALFATPERRTRGRGLPDDPLVPPQGSDLRRFLDDLRPILESPRLELVGHDLKSALHVLGRYGIRPRAVALDVMLASYCLDAHQSQHGLEFLAQKHLGVPRETLDELLEKGQQPADVPPARLLAWAGEGAALSWLLATRLDTAIGGSEVEHVFRDIEMPLLPVLQRMEEAGVLVDRAQLQRLGSEMGERLEALTREIHALAGEPFNIASPKQLAEVLFEKLRLHEQLGLRRVKRTKTGYSTDASVLEQLAEHPLGAKLLEHRQLAKLKGTYVDALPELVHPVTGRIHTCFHQAVAATGRLSSADPNLQNIPVRTPEGRRIREAFVAAPGFLLLSADYSQVELRLLAHLSGDAALRNAFHSGEDIHRRTASLVFGVPVAEVTPEMRSRSKSINFGIVYGMGPQRLAQQTGVSVKEAAAFIESYFATFPDVKNWLERTREQARAEGCVSTLAGRRRQLEFDRNDPRGYAAVMNMAVNTPIQGTAADLAKIAMIRAQRALDARGSRARMILQVHDELVFEVPEEELESTRPLVVEAMAGAMTLEVPLVVDTGAGRTWLAAHASPSPPGLPTAPP